MQTRTFQAGNMTEAMQLVKAELGADAMIISSRKERRGGILGLFTKPVFRITAAASVPEPRGAGLYREAERQEETTRDEFRRSMLEPLARELKDLRERVEALSDERLKARSEAAAGDGYRRATELGGSNPAAEDPREPDGFRLDPVLAGPVSAGEAAAGEGVLPRISSALHDAGVGETAIRALAARVKSALPRDGMKEGLNEALKGAMESLVKCTGPIRLKKNGAKIVALVGPTGVGKTTTIAKLAALYTIGRKARVALVTVDTFRVGAVEQLKTYSRIMGVPLEVASNRTELEKAVESHADKDLILIDTVGRSPKDAATIESLRAMLDLPFAVETHLCIAATTREKELHGILDSFGALPVSRILFTKLDESSSFGTLLNLQIEKKLPLSYLTKGQRVPEDIEPATGRKIAELILGAD